METGRAEAWEKAPLSELLSWEDRLGNERLQSSPSYYLYSVRGFMLHEGRKCQIEYGSRCHKSWEVCLAPSVLWL